MFKLLLIAPACDGEDVGEAWSAYRWVRELAARNEVTILTYYKRGRTPVSRQLHGARVVEWPEPPGVGRAERLNSMLKPGYVPFYFHARSWIRRALARGEHFDLAHQLVPLAMRYPSPVAGLGIPFIMGPVGGSLQSPPGFGADEDTSPWYMGLRRLDVLRIQRDPWLRRTYQQASSVIGIAPYVKEFLSGVGLQRFDVMSDTGIERLPEPIARTGRGGEVRLLYVGRLVRTKGARDAIRALSLTNDLTAVLQIVGDGFDRAACENLTAELGLNDRVRFHGRLPRNEIDDLYRSADIFLFPSYREAGGNVVFEAMSYGLPLIVSDIGGPGYAVDDTCGIRLHPVSPDTYARDLAAAITRLVTNETLRLELGGAARRRVADIALWERKVGQLETIYSEILAARPSL